MYVSETGLVKVYSSCSRFLLFLLTEDLQVVPSAKRRASKSCTDFSLAYYTHFCRNSFSKDMDPSHLPPTMG